MGTDNVRRLLDAFYMAKRVRDMLPPLPEGVTASYIRFLDTIQILGENNRNVRVSDIGEVLNLRPPGVTRTIKEMEAAGYVKKYGSDDDGRVTYVSITEEGEKLSEKYNHRVFEALSQSLGDISDEDAETAIRVTKRFYDFMCAGRLKID